MTSFRKWPRNSVTVHWPYMMLASCPRGPIVGMLMMEAETEAFDAIGVCRDQRWLVLVRCDHWFSIVPSVCRNNTRM